MAHYYYKCFNCQTEYGASFIEDTLQYLCPKCGSAEKQMPLQGVLTVEYAYDSLKKYLVRDKFISSEPGNLTSYCELLPLTNRYGEFTNLPPGIVETLTLPSRPVSKYRFEEDEISILDDTRNPTLSLKDRASILVVLKALQKGIKEISAASTGNAGSSLAGICARAGLRPNIFVPERIPEAKRMQIQIYGANLNIVQGDYDQAFDLCLEISNELKWYNRNTAYNPLTIEGKKTASYDLFISMKGSVPDYIFIPSGDGVILSGIYKGFYDLLKLGWIEKIPALMCVQAEGSDAIARFIRANEFTYKPAESVADSICAGAPRNLYMAAHAVRSGCGEAVTVSDKEILQAQSIAAKQFGILAEPAAAASLAGYLKYRTFNDLSGKNIVLMFTGNGMKDISALLTNIGKAESFSADEIKKKLLNK